MKIVKKPHSEFDTNRPPNETGGPSPSESVAKVLNYATLLAKQVGTYVAAVGAAVTAFLTAWTKLGLQNRYGWWGLGLSTFLISSPVLIVMVTVTLPQWRTRRRTKWLVQLGEERTVGPERFPLRPLEERDHASFERPDRADQRVIDFILSTDDPILYLTGASGTGKSSIVQAWVLPALRKHDPPVRVVLVRGYGNPIRALQEELKKPGVVWERRNTETDARDMLERAAKQLTPARLLIVFDQFEEFLIAREDTAKEAVKLLLNSLIARSIPGVRVLVVCRSDYLGELQDIGLPPLRGYENWIEVGPFNRASARRFIDKAGLALAAELSERALDEAAELESTPGMFRPIVLNMLGRALERFAGVPIPHAARGQLVRTWLSEIIREPVVRDIAPPILDVMITEGGGKCPRFDADLAERSHTSLNLVRGCLRWLALQGLVRELDRDRGLWEIAHDFVAHMLLPVVTRVRPNPWNRLRPVLGWFAVGVWVVCLLLAVYAWPSWRYVTVRRNLADIGFSVRGTRGRQIVVSELAREGDWKKFLTTAGELGTINCLAITDSYMGTIKFGKLPPVNEIVISGNISTDQVEFLDVLPATQTLVLRENPYLHKVIGMDKLTGLQSLGVYQSGETGGLPFGSYRLDDVNAHVGSPGLELQGVDKIRTLGVLNMTFDKIDETLSDEIAGSNITLLLSSPIDPGMLKRINSKRPPGHTVRTEPPIPVLDKCYPPEQP